MSTKETFVDLTLDELKVLCDLLSCPLPIGVLSDDDHDLEPLPASYKDRLHRAAEAALFARRILLHGLTRTEVVAAVKAVVEVAATPAVIASLEIDHDEYQETIFLLADPDLAVEVAAIGLGTYRFTPFLPRELVRRLGRRSALRPADVVADEAARVGRTTLTEAHRLAVQDPLAGARHLVAAGVASPTALALTHALADQECIVTATILHRDCEHKAVGGMVSWIQAGLSGNWLSEDVGADQHGEPDLVSLRSVAAGAILSELASYLPPGFTQPAAEETASKAASSAR